MIGEIEVIIDLKKLEKLLKIAFEFEKNVIIKKTKKGWIAECKKGLFSINGNSEDLVRSEAMHYFVQYQKDGEYKK